MHGSLSAGERTSHVSVLPTSQSLLGTPVRHLLPMAFFVSAARRVFFQGSVLFGELTLQPSFLLLCQSQFTLGQGPPRLLLRGLGNRRLRTVRSWVLRTQHRSGTSQVLVPVLTFMFLLFVSNLTTRAGLLGAAGPGACIPGNLRECFLGGYGGWVEQSPRRRSSPRCSEPPPSCPVAKALSPSLPSGS